MVAVDKIDAQCDLHNSLCLALSARTLLMDLTLAWRRSLSAFLIIFLAFSVLIVVFNLMLTGTKSLVIQFKSEDPMVSIIAVHYLQSFPVLK